VSDLEPDNWMYWVVYWADGRGAACVLRQTTDLARAEVIRPGQDWQPFSGSPWHDAWSDTASEGMPQRKVSEGQAQDVIRGWPPADPR